MKICRVCGTATCICPPKRMRKEKPTMAMYPSASLPAISDGVREFPTVKAAYESAMAGEKILVRPIVSFEGIQTAPLVPLGNCPNVPGPCGHCWYCRQASPNDPESYFEFYRQRAIVLGGKWW